MCPCYIALDIGPIPSSCGCGEASGFQKAIAQTSPLPTYTLFRQSYHKWHRLCIAQLIIIEKTFFLLFPSGPFVFLVSGFPQISDDPWQYLIFGSEILKGNLCVRLVNWCVHCRMTGAGCFTGLVNFSRKESFNLLLGAYKLTVFILGVK